MTENLIVKVLTSWTTIFLLLAILVGLVVNSFRSSRSRKRSSD